MIRRALKKLWPIKARHRHRYGLPSVVEGRPCLDCGRPDPLGARFGEGPFLSMDEIVTDIIENATQEDAMSWLGVSEAELPLAHQTTGRLIRNHYGLWDPANPHTGPRACADDLEVDADGIVIDARHPDNFSGAVLERVWRHFNHQQERRHDADL